MEGSFSPRLDLPTFAVVQPTIYCELYLSMCTVVMKFCAVFEYLLDNTHYTTRI